MYQNISTQVFFLQCYFKKDQAKACNESWVQQSTPLDSWTLTARISLNKCLISVIKEPDYDFKLPTYVVFNKHEIYHVDELSSEYG